MIPVLMTPYVAHAAGILAFVLIVLSLQSNKRKNILNLMSSGLVFQTIHFLLLSAYIAAVMVGVSVVRNIICQQKEKYLWARHPSVLFIFIVVFVVLTVMFWQGWPSLLVLAGTIAGTLTFWMDSPKHIRLLTIIASSIWFPYGIIVNSFSTAALQVFVIASVCIAMYRFDVPELRGKWIKKHRGME